MNRQGETTRQRAERRKIGRLVFMNKQTIPEIDNDEFIRLFEAKDERYLEYCDLENIQQPGSAFWFPNELPSAKVDSFVNSPAAFRRRGIFISPQELNTV
jgi:hypothetical protein